MHRNISLKRKKKKLPFKNMKIILMTIWAASWQNQQNDCAPSEDSDQPGHPPSLTRVFAVRMKKAWVLSYPLTAQRRLWSDWADAHADLSLRWVHSHFVGFVTRRLIIPWLVLSSVFLFKSGTFLLEQSYLLSFEFNTNHSSSFWHLHVRIFWKCYNYTLPAVISGH